MDVVVPGADDAGRAEVEEERDDEERHEDEGRAEGQLWKGFSNHNIRSQECYFS